MIRHIYLGAVLLLYFNFEGTFSLKPPQNVKLVKSQHSQLLWKSEDGVLCSLQYKRASNLEDEWQNVSGYTGTKLKSFDITNEYYGAVFRVRAEKGNDKSEWVNSDLVQCVHVNCCAPVINLTVKPERIFLTMEHMDKSLEKEYGANLEFNISYWKVDGNEQSKVHTIPTNNKNEAFVDLESGKNYCFQVGYLHYNQAYGNVSEKRCELVPESPEAAQQRAWLFSILLTLLVVAMCGVCIFGLFRNHKKVKKFLQPLPLEIPRHYEEFLSGDFPLQLSSSPSSQSLRSYDMITVIENENVEHGQEEQYEKRS